MGKLKDKMGNIWQNKRAKRSELKTKEDAETIAILNLIKELKLINMH